MLPVFFIFFWTRVKGRIHSCFLESMRRRPYKRLIKVLSELQNGMNELKGREFYTELIDASRIYLTARGRIDYNTATAGEASVSIASDFADAAGHEALIRLFQLSDEVKFGSRRVMMYKREEALMTIKKTADEIEESASGGGKNVDT